MSIDSVVSVGRVLRQRSQVAPLHVAGGDFGNETAVLVDGARMLQIPSYMAVGNLHDLLTSRAGAGGEGTLGPGEYALAYDGLTWFVGQLALEQCDDATAERANSGRYTGGHTLRLLMALVGALYDGDVRLRLVTGVPPALMKDQAQIGQDIAESLCGTHSFTIHDHRGSRDVLLVIEHVVTMMEGVATMMTYATPGRPIGLIDIGGYSVDTAFLGADGKILDSRTQSLVGSGVSRLGELISEHVRSQYGRTLRPRERDAVLASYRAGATATIYQRGAQAISYATMRQMCSNIAGRQMAFLAQYWADGDATRVGADAERVIVIGGGAFYFPPHLQIATAVVVPDAPFAANAQAYAAFARRIEARGTWKR